MTMLWKSSQSKIKRFQPSTVISTLAMLVKLANELLKSNSTSNYINFEMKTTRIYWHFDANNLHTIISLPQIPSLLSPHPDAPPNHVIKHYQYQIHKTKTHLLLVNLQNPRHVRHLVQFRNEFHDRVVDMASVKWLAPLPGFTNGQEWSMTQVMQYFFGG